MEDTKETKIPKCGFCSIELKPGAKIYCSPKCRSRENTFNWLYRKKFPYPTVTAFFPPGVATFHSQPLVAFQDKCIPSEKKFEWVNDKLVPALWLKKESLVDMRVTPGLPPACVHTLFLRFVTRDMGEDVPPIWGGPTNVIKLEHWHDQKMNVCAKADLENLIKGLDELAAIVEYLSGKLNQKKS